MQQELKTHIEKIEAKLLRHESSDTFTFEFVSDLVQSFKDIVEKPIDTTKDVYEIRKEYSVRLQKDFYYGYKNNNYIGLCESNIDEANLALDKYINSNKTEVVITREVSNG
jgi:hypothetical protein